MRTVNNVSREVINKSNKSHYHSIEYDSKERFCSYWQQITEAISFNPNSVLEIGVGNRFVYSYLKERQINIMSFDIDETLKPDFIGSVLLMPFDNNSFDLVLCYQVLEHLPYEYFNRALAEIYRVTQNNVIISLPDVEQHYKINMKFLKGWEVKKYIEIPRRNSPIHRFDGEHYWEIGKKDFPINRILKDMRKVGFNIERTYRLYENIYHRFFILSKTQKYNNKLNIKQTNMKIGHTESRQTTYYEESLTFRKIINLLFISIKIFLLRRNK